MHLLLESDRREGLGIGAVASFVLHAALLGLLLLAYRERPLARSLVDQFVTFLVPPSKPTGQEGNAPVSFSGSGTGTEGEGANPSGPTTISTGPVTEEPADTTSDGPSPEDMLADIMGESVLTEVEVDSTVQRYEGSAAPAYPPELLARNVEGSAFVMYVVDTTGVVDTNTFRVIRATHYEFAQAVREALSGMKFRAAMLSGRRVRQLVQQNFAFKITRPATDSTTP